MCESGTLDIEAGSVFDDESARFDRTEASTLLKEQLAVTCAGTNGPGCTGCNPHCVAEVSGDL